MSQIHVNIWNLQFKCKDFEQSPTWNLQPKPWQAALGFHSGADAWERSPEISTFAAVVVTMVEVPFAHFANLLVLSLATPLFSAAQPNLLPVAPLLTPLANAALTGALWHFEVCLFKSIPHPTHLGHYILCPMVRRPSINSIYRWK